MAGFTAFFSDNSVYAKKGECTVVKVLFLDVGNVICVSYLPKLDEKWQACLFQWYGLLLFAVAIRHDFLNSYEQKEAHCTDKYKMEQISEAVHLYDSHINS